MDNLPDSPVVLLPKHQSTWETFAFPGLMPHPLCYVFKRELIYIPFFGWAMGRLDMIHIDRSKRAEAWNLVAAQGREFRCLGAQYRLLGAQLRIRGLQSLEAGLLPGGHRRAGQDQGGDHTHFNGV